MRKFTNVSSLLNLLYTIIKKTDFGASLSVGGPREGVEQGMPVKSQKWREKEGGRLILRIPFSMGVN